MQSTANPPPPNDENLWFRKDVVVNLAEVTIPTPKVLKLLLTLITLDIVRHPRDGPLVPLQYSDFVRAWRPRHRSFIKLSNELPRHLTQSYIKNSIATSGMLGVGAQHRDINKAHWFLVHICLAHGNDIIEANGDLEIPGFPIGVKQFILAKPKRHFHSKIWSQKKAKLLKFKTEPYWQSSPVSTLLFHGAEMSHFQSILREGFTGAADYRFGNGLFMAEDPSTSWSYARERPLSQTAPPLSPFSNSPYKGYGLLLGCEVLGSGRPVHPVAKPKGSHVHVIQDFASIMPRYLFLIPPGGGTGSIPLRAEVKSRMMSVFRKIEDGRYAKDYKRPGLHKRVIPGSRTALKWLRYVFMRVFSPIRYIVASSVHIVVSIVSWIGHRIAQSLPLFLWYLLVIVQWFEYLRFARWVMWSVISDRMPPLRYQLLAISWSDVFLFLIPVFKEWFDRYVRPGLERSNRRPTSQAEFIRMYPTVEAYRARRY
ncbi:hypothetical protein VTL71DRAFT_1436 [Oculimacula yallundae]|uniref:PARP catalytic domain-containing protein n=1 Tax=Oculimacula yallundae TaxID=86028 RepID=A0ABR4CAN8_9HELO